MLNAARAYRNALTNGLSKGEKPKILNKLAKNYNRLKSFDLAISFARQLVEGFPLHALAVDARIEIGTMLQAKGNYRESIQEMVPLLKLVDKNDQWSSVQFSIAESYFLLDEYDNARREFLKIRYNARGSTNWIASAQFYVARCYAAQGEYRRAIQELEEIKIRFGATSDFGLQAEQTIREFQAKLN